MASEISASQPNIVVQQKAPWWIESIKHLGLPTVLLIAMSYGVYRTGIWTGETIVIPMYNRQMLFIDKVEKSVEAMASAVEEHAASVDELKADLESIDQGVKEGTAAQRANGLKLDKIDSTLKGGG